MRESNSKTVFDMLEYYNLNVICFTVTLSSIDVLAKKVSEIMKEKQSSYNDFTSISVIDMILVYLHKIPVDIFNFICH